MKHEEILHRCFRCGYCKLPSNYTDINCPAYQAFRFETYSPGGRMWLLRAWLNNEISNSRRFGEIMFSCATCGNCVEQCAFPNFKDLLLEVFAAGKEAFLDAGQVPAPVRDYLTKVQLHGNPYGKPGKKRLEWAADLDIPVFSDQDYLFFVDDVGAFDTRGQELARSVAKMLQQAGISFGILSGEEASDGNDVHEMGETPLFEELAKKNIEIFKQKGVQKIITLSPHSLHAIKNHYPALGGSYQVVHYTQLLAFSLDGLKFQSKGSNQRITFHDPCYLGRRNWDYQSPRMLLKALPDMQVIEMDRNQKNAFCCGGGGGNLFTDLLSAEADSPGRVRVREAAETGADVLAVACPQCAVMLEDAAKVEGLENRLQVKEVTEIMAEYL